jgi:hypothetical protein
VAQHSNVVEALRAAVVSPPAPRYCNNNNNGTIQAAGSSPFSKHKVRDLKSPGYSIWVGESGDYAGGGFAEMRKGIQCGTGTRQTQTNAGARRQSDILYQLLYCTGSLILTRPRAHS